MSSADPLDALLPYQREGIAFLTRKPYLILGDDTGLGKTAQVLLACEALRYLRILVLCPLIGTVAWRIETGKWSLNERAFRIFQKNVAIPDGPLVYVIPYSSLSVKLPREAALRQVQKANDFDVVVIDEGHYLSNWNSQRTVAVYGKWCSYAHGLIDYAKPKSVWILSGTIQRRDVRDLYPHLKALFPDVVNQAMGRPADAPIRKFDFENEFLLFDATGFGITPIGNNPRTIPKLREALRPYVLVRRKKDVAPQLGTVRQFDLPLGIDPSDPYRDQVKHPEFGKALAEELFAATSLHTALALSETAAEERRVLGMIKVRPVAAWVEDWFANAAEDEKLVVFCWHRDVIREMEERLRAYHPVTVMGGITDNKRNAAVRDFQNDKRVRVFIGQTVAASTSITLTASSTVITMEPDWLPYNDYQAVSRVHRLGQTQPVFNYRAFVSGTIDSRIHARANARLRDFQQLMDGLVTHPDKENEHAHAS